jgi:hypothetical protein
MATDVPDRRGMGKRLMDVLLECDTAAIIQEFPVPDKRAVFPSESWSSHNAPPKKTSIISREEGLRASKYSPRIPVFPWQSQAILVF